MSRKPTPGPESEFIGPGAWIALAIALPALLSPFLTWCFVIFAVPMMIYLLYLAYGAGLLLAAAWRWRGTPIRGILVTSDSPFVRPHIENHWMPRLAEKVVVINWSQRNRWKETLPVKIFRRFGIDGNHKNFCPLVVRLRGLRHPHVYRCRYAFRDLKHENSAAIEKLEAHLFKAFER